MLSPIHDKYGGKLNFNSLKERKSVKIKLPMDIKGLFIIMRINPINEEIVRKWRIPKKIKLFRSNV